MVLNFYPRSPCGERLGGRTGRGKRSDFYPRSPCGERPRYTPSSSRSSNFYPRSPCGERLTWYQLTPVRITFLSTFPLRGTSYGSREAALGYVSFLSTFPLRGTSPLSRYCRPPEEFLSTFPLRGTSLRITLYFVCPSYFYPRSPCGERPGVNHAVPVHTQEISIHVPLAGNVRTLPGVIAVRVEFLSTFPLRGTSRRCPVRIQARLSFLSTFPLRGTSIRTSRPRPARAYFYPRSPCGERLPGSRLRPPRRSISIHVPLAGNVGPGRVERLIAVAFLSTFPLRGTSKVCASCCTSLKHFYPRSPCGERLLREEYWVSEYNFYPRSPCGERPQQRRPRRKQRSNFYPRSPCGERPGWCQDVDEAGEFLSTFPLRGTSIGVRGVDLTGVGISIHVPLAGNVARTAGPRP